MRACGAARISDCLKRPGSRLIIAKTKDRKIGDFEVLADAKQYKKALTEETGFDFDDKRYPKYHKETLEEMGYVLCPVHNAPNKPLTAKVWSERRDGFARGIFLSPGQAPPWNDYDLLGDSKVNDLLRQIKLDDSNKITIVNHHNNFIKPLEEIAQCKEEYVDYKHQVNVYLNLIGDTKIFMLMNRDVAGNFLPGDLLIAVPQPIFDQEEEYIFECARDNQTHDYYKSTIGLCFALTNKDGKLQYCKFCLHKKCIKKQQVRQLDWILCDKRYELAMKKIYFKPRDLKMLFRARWNHADTRKTNVNRMVEQMRTRHNEAEIAYFLSGPEVYLGEPIKPKDHDKVVMRMSQSGEQIMFLREGGAKMPKQQMLAKVDLMKNITGHKSNFKCGCKMAKQTKIYKTKPFWKFRKLGTAITVNPSEHVDWTDIVRDKIMPCLQNPLTGQTGTEAEKKSLMKFIEECKNRPSFKWAKRQILSMTKDPIGREYTLEMEFASNRSRSDKNSIRFVIEQRMDSFNEDGTPRIGETETWKQVSEFKVFNGLKMEAVWDAHFEASCRFNDLTKGNCACEHLMSNRNLSETSQSNRWYYRCHHSKSTNSKFCFAHMHANCRKF